MKFKTSDIGNNGEKGKIVSIDQSLGINTCIPFIPTTMFSVHNKLVKGNDDEKVLIENYCNYLHHKIHHPQGFPNHLYIQQLLMPRFIDITQNDADNFISGHENLKTMH